MRYFLFTAPLLACSLALNICLWTGWLVPENQVGALASQMAYAEPIAIMAGRE